MSFHSEGWRMWMIASSRSFPMFVPQRSTRSATRLSSQLGSYPGVRFGMFVDENAVNALSADTSCGTAQSAQSAVMSSSDDESLTPEGRRGVATGGAMRSERNPWSSLIVDESPGGAAEACDAEGRRTRHVRSIQHSADSCTPAGVCRVSDHRFHGLRDTRVSLRPWLHSVTPFGVEGACRGISRVGSAVGTARRVIARGVVGVPTQVERW